MHKSLVDILVDPITKKPLEVEVCQWGPDEEILEGLLYSPERKVYVVTRGIPRFVATEDKAQKQTENSFGYKWKQYHTYDSTPFRMTAQNWLIQRYGFKDPMDMRAYFIKKQRILDAGCGSGFSTSLWVDPFWKGDFWIGVDISEAIDVARERLGSIKNTHFVQADILSLPFLENSFDTIFAEGVLHHAPSTEMALKALVSLLQKGGEMMFYVYREKGPIREFTDDYIRNIISMLPPEKAWDLLRPLTKLGQALAELRTEVEVLEDIPYLDIKAGRYDIQRLIYWHFAKLFWNEAFTFEENHHVNFDWYHPQYAHRQTEEEVRRWCSEAGLSIFHFDVQESGFTVRAIKD
jgi:ubiquinone/menaquinone biosynthesis C-methylase UbiE